MKAPTTTTNRCAALATAVLLGLMVLSTKTVDCVELTFELMDNAKDCFYEEILKNTSVLLEYQVVTGGHYDVDVELLSPTKQVLYSQVKTQFDSHKFTAEISGIYAVCFGNEFSTFSHKLIYMDLQVGDETAALQSHEDHHTALTKMETSAQEVHKSLLKVADAQTHHRLREAQGRKRAEDINERILWWSIIETFGILTISICQVLVLRNFFTDRKPGSTSNYGRL